MDGTSSDEESASQTNRIDLSYLQLGDNPMGGHLHTLLKPTSSEGKDDTLSNDIAQNLYLQHNQLSTLPLILTAFTQLRVLDLSYNQLTHIGSEIVQLTNLKVLVAKNNLLNDHSLPKEFGQMTSLEELNLSGNSYTTIVPQILELENLKGLFLGGNQLDRIPAEIRKLNRLQILYLGGNQLHELPATMGQLQALQALILCENKLESLPSTISHLRRLRSLSLHKNCLTTLPPEIVRLQGLTELSLRDNPLVVRFVLDMVYNPPSLLELAARAVKLKNVHYKADDLPHNLQAYLRTAHRCVNPKCKGVYFDACVEHIKFVDFCGKYRIPLLQYLCSPRCKTNATYASSESEMSEDDLATPESRLKKVLLG